MYTITTHVGRVMLTDFAIADSSVWAHNIEGSQEFFEDVHSVWERWLSSGLSQDEYFTHLAHYFELTLEQKATLMRE